MNLVDIIQLIPHHVLLPLLVGLAIMFLVATLYYSVRVLLTVLYFVLGKSSLNALLVRGSTNAVILAIIVYVFFFFMPFAVDTIIIGIYRERENFDEFKKHPGTYTKLLPYAAITL